MDQTVPTFHQYTITEGWLWANRLGSSELAALTILEGCLQVWWDVLQH
jgi:hypothetical protein